MKAARLGSRIVRGAFFARLMTKAVEFLKDPEKLRDLVQSAGSKAEGVRATDALKEIWSTLMAFLRLLRAYVRGDYRNVPFKSLVLIIAAVLYFVMPFDVIPDFVVGIGFVDDAAVLAWVFSVVRKVVDDFTAWEGSRGDVHPPAA